MKRIFFTAFSILSLIASAQTTLTGDRVVAKQGLYVKDKWTDSIQTSGAFLSNRAIPTSKAVDSFFKLRGQDSSVIWYLPNQMRMGGRFNQLVLSNVGRDSIPTPYQAAQGTQNGPYNQATLLINRKFNEAKNDTLNLQYGGAVVAYNEHRFDSASTRFRYDATPIALPNGGFYGDNRFYPPRDSVNVYAGGDGQNAGAVVGYLSIGDTWGYNLNIISTLPKMPLATYKSELDLQRNISPLRRRKMTGNGLANYYADWKDYQTSISPTTFEGGDYHSRVVDFFSNGGRSYQYIGSGATKDKILKVAKVDTAIGFYSSPKYMDNNEVWNGYGFYQEGVNDFNYLQGKTKIGGATAPTRDNGGIAQTLSVTGSTYSDTLVTKVLKGATNAINVDSSSQIKYTAKVGTVGGGFLMDMRSTLDSTETGSNVAGGIFMYRNWSDFKTNGNFQAPFDARDYLNIGANRTVNLGGCPTCVSNSQYHGYKQIIAAAGVTVSSLSAAIKPSIYLARNEIWSSSSTNKVRANDLELVGYTAQVLTGPNTDTLGGYVAFKDIGVTVSGANKVLNYYAFKTDVTNVADNTFGFYQSQSNVKNYLAGPLKLGDVLNLPATTAPSSSSDASGTDGDIKRDASGNLYLKNGSTWLKFTGTTF